MSEPMPPALTPEEWAKKTVRSRYNDFEVYTEAGRLVAIDDESVAMVPDELLHAAAALALYGWPFGFTWEDVALLGEIGGDMDHPDGSKFPDTPLYECPLSHAEVVRVRAIAARIAALLPPREVG